MRDFPYKPIRLITEEVGGGGDTVTRLIASGMSGSLGQPVNVDSHAGTTAIELLLQEPADGYTLLVFAQTLWNMALFKSTLWYDPIRDFSPITWATTSPLIVVAHPSVRASSVGELILLAQSRPGEMRYAAGLNGSSSHLAGALFAYMAGLKIPCVRYKTGPLGLRDLIAGKVQLMILTAGTVMPYVKAGKLKALAVTSAQPSALVPGLPTVATAVPGYEMASTTGIFAPAKTPAAVVSRLNQEMVIFLKTPFAKEHLFEAGFEAVGSTPEELAGKIKSEMANWINLMRDIDIVAS